jgi:hypothetical protein
MGGLYRRWRLEQLTKQPKQAEVIAAPEQEQGQSQEGPEGPVSTLTPEHVENMTRNQMMAELKRLKVEFSERDNAAKLRETLLKALQ